MQDSLIYSQPSIYKKQPPSLFAKKSNNDLCIPVYFIWNRNIIRGKDSAYSIV
jgi:hypothetical protein